MGDGEAVGTVTLVYDHHASDLADKLTEHQHSSPRGDRLDTAHPPRRAQLPRGRRAARRGAPEIKRLADGLIGTKGVKHGKFVATTTGDGIV